MSAKLKVVWLCDRRYHETKMSRCRFEYARAIQRHPDVECLFTGNGLLGYDETLSVAENLKRLHFDAQVVLAYKPEDHIQFREVKALKVVSYNEAWWKDDRAAKECIQHGVDLVVCHHENDLARFSKLGLNAVHTPHCVNLSIFTPGGVGTLRPSPLIVTGVMSEEIYPLRTRVAKMIWSDRVVGYVRKHPGYRLPSQRTCNQQYRDYASSLRMNRIAFVCSSIHKYALAKYIEAFASGCLVIGDMPDDELFRRTLGKWMIEINPCVSDEEIVKCIDSWLVDRPDMVTLASMAAGGRRTAEQFSVERYANDFVDHCRKALFF